MATSTEAMSRERVSRWRRRGLTADEFAAQEKGLQASTLRYWSSRLRSAPAPVQTAALELRIRSVSTMLPRWTPAT